ncbi:MAG TPA: hypothetical protein VJC15_00840 [Candidatus Paceibacterota bacterium]
MEKSGELSNMVIEAFQEGLRQAGLDEEGFRLLIARKEEFCGILIGEIRSSIEAVTNERLRDILVRSSKLEEKFRKNPESAVVDAKNLMQDAASTGSSVRERQQRARLEALISYWASVLRIQTGGFVLGPRLDPCARK